MSQCKIVSTDIKRQNSLKKIVRQRMDHYQTFSHIDFCFRAPAELVSKSNHPKGYWYITEIVPAHSATIWKKRTDGKWVRIASSPVAYEEEAIRSGSLIKRVYDGVVFAAGGLHNRLDSKLMDHMLKENKTQYPYNYWEKSCLEAFSSEKYK